MDNFERISGAEQLIAIFGYWPSFHDAEVLWISLDRKSHGKVHGPLLEALVHTFEMSSEVGADGYYVLRNHVLVHLRFQHVVDLQLDGFNHQNALMALNVTDVRDLQIARVSCHVEFDSAHGVSMSFQCENIEVVSVAPCSKNGEPIQSA